jgi:hypothetical protein
LKRAPRPRYTSHVTPPLVAFHPAASVAAGVLVIGGGVAVGALVMRGLMRLAQAAPPPQNALPPATPAPVPACPEGTRWSDEAQRCIAVVGPQESPPPTPPIPTVPDEWGTRMRGTSTAFVDGLALRLFEDHQGKWHFAYSWRTDRGATGNLAQYLRDDPDEDTVLVMSHSDDAGSAYQEAINWVEKRLVPFVRDEAIPNAIPPSVVASAPIMYEIEGADHWVLVGPTLRSVEGSEGLRYWDYQEPEYFGLTRNGESSVGGCCYDHDQAWTEALRYY